MILYGTDVRDSYKEIFVIAKIWLVMLYI